MGGPMNRTGRRADSCAYLAGLLGDSLVATANETAAWILLEHAGPWGKDALAESGLDPDLVAEVKHRMAATGARVQLISPPPRARPAWLYLVADPGHGQPWLARMACGSPHDVLRIDFAALVAGVRPAAAEPVTAPLYAVCANEMSDPCCGTAGPPVLAAATRVAGRRCRKTAHLGGHKYAANMMIFPPGLCFGRLGPASVLDVITAAEDGRIHLGQYRGRAAYRAADQAAEHFLRVELGITRVADVTLAEPAGPGASRFAVQAETDTAAGYEVLVHAERQQPPRLQSCTDSKATVPVAWVCDGIRPWTPS